MQEDLLIHLLHGKYTRRGDVSHPVSTERYKVSYKETFLQEVQQVKTLEKSSSLNTLMNVWQNDLGVHLNGDRWNIMCRIIFNSLSCNKIIE